jgi:hypothetical protein
MQEVKRYDGELIWNDNVGMINMEIMNLNKLRHSRSYPLSICTYVNAYFFQVLFRCYHWNYFK